MPKTATKKERIIELSDTFSPKEIANIVGTSVSYVNKIVKCFVSSSDTPSLTLKSYIDAHCKGITKKKDLAAFFGVSRMAIYRFENRPEIKFHFEQYMKLRRCGYHLYEIKKSISDIFETISIFEPDSRQTMCFKQIMTILEKATN